MRTYHYRSLVRLSEEQRRWLETMLHTSRTPAKHYLVARVVLLSDQSQGEPEATDGQKASILSISRRTVMRIKQRFVQGSLEMALTGSFQRERPERRCLDGKGGAQLIHLACTTRLRLTTLEPPWIPPKDPTFPITRPFLPRPRRKP